MVALIVLFIAVFYKPDLSKSQLKKYISESSKFMLLDNGAKMHYRDQGNRSGEVILLIHGRFTSLHAWERSVEHLKKDYRIISVDILGHGLTGKYPENIYTRTSHRDALHMLLEKLNINRYNIAGCSFGGAIAIEMALKYPDEINNMILINSEGISFNEFEEEDEMLANEYSVSPDDPKYNKLSILQKIGCRIVASSLIKHVLADISHDDEAVTDSLINYCQEILQYNGNREAQVLMLRQELYELSKNRDDLLPQLSKITTPTLVIHCDKNGKTSMRISKLFNNNITNSKFKHIDGPLYLPMVDKPKEISEAMSEFISNKSN